MKWTKFWDMHSGGRSKEKWDIIYIQAPEEEAKLIFYNRFGHNPERVTCTCCGEDYSISEGNSFEQISGFHRNCAFENNKYVERKGEYGDYIPVKDYVKRSDILVIKSEDIKPEERLGKIPKQGYVWVD